MRFPPLVDVAFYKRQQEQAEQVAEEFREMRRSILERSTEKRQAEEAKLAQRDALDAQIGALYRQGKTRAAIGQAVGVGKSRIENALHRLGLSVKRDPAPVAASPEAWERRKKRVAELHAEGFRDPEIAGAVGLTARQVRTVRKMLGLGEARP